MSCLPTPKQWLEQFLAMRRCDGATVATLDSRPAPATVADVALSQRANVESALGAPLTLRDGRRLWRVRSSRDGADTVAAAALIAEARAARIVAVADNAVLSICAPAGYRGDLPHRLATKASDVLAALHRQSDERIARMRETVERG